MLEKPEPVREGVADGAILGKNPVPPARKRLAGDSPRQDTALRHGEDFDDVVFPKPVNPPGVVLGGGPDRQTDLQVLGVDKRERRDMKKFPTVANMLFP